MKKLRSILNLTRQRRTWSTALVLLISSALIAGCEDNPLDSDLNPGDNDNNNDVVSVEADFTVNPDEPILGDEIELDAGDTDVSGTSGETYSWTLEAPEESETELSSTDGVTSTFEPDLPGEYSIALEVSADGESDETTQTIEVAAIEEISEDITTDKTLFEHTQYIVVNDISISAQVTIEPGTTVEFEQATHFRVVDGGSLIADGTAEESILLTGTDETAGHWDGLWYDGSTSTSNLLNHVTVEYAGNPEADFFSGHDETAGIYVGGRTSGSDSWVEITNSTLQNNSGYGLALVIGSELRNADNNLYTLNADGAVYTEAQLIHQLSETSDYTGNLDENDHIHVSGQDVEGDDRTWNALNAPYIMQGTTHVTDLNLTVAAGAEFLFQNEGKLIYEGEQAFEVNGTQDDPVIFSATEDEAGWWGGIQLYDAKNPSNSIDWTLIEYGGGHEMFNFSTQDEFANLLIGARTESASSRLTLTNSTLRHSAGYGLKLSKINEEFPDSERNEYTENAEGAVYLTANTMHYLDSDSDYSGNLNGNDFVRVERADVTGTEKTWSALNVPYRMSGETHPQDVSIVIEPGAEFEFTSEAGISFRDDSVIDAVGTEDNMIHFTGTEEVKGWWAGIQISSDSPDNVIEYARFDYGGAESGFSNYSTQDDFANLIIGGRTDSHAGRATVQNNTFANSSGYGLKIRPQSDVVNADPCGDNTFSDNDDGTCLDQR
ncbi:MAG: hypothetical protein ACQER4_02895 [Bacteroidota bacterium]